MHQNKFVVCAKVNGKVLREQGETVRIPFGAEYTLHLKNLNSVRALVTVEIDGQDATEGIRLIVPANGALDLERFIKNGNMNAGNCFKFIERTSKIEEHRGVGAEDGLIRIEYEFEQLPQPRTPPSVFYKTPHLRGGDFNTYSSTAVDSFNSMSGGGYAELGSARSFLNSIATANSVNDAGITVAGSESSQKFSYGAWFPTDGIKHVMVMKIIGQVNGEPVQVPVTVKMKPTCSTCGTVNKGSAKFCMECGTALTIL